MLCLPVAVQLVETAFPHEHHARDRSDSRLEYLIRELESCLLRRTVNKRSAERVADDHYHGAERCSDTG